MRRARRAGPPPLAWWCCEWPLMSQLQTRSAPPLQVRAAEKRRSPRRLQPVTAVVAGAGTARCRPTPVLDTHRHRMCRPASCSQSARPWCEGSSHATHKCRTGRHRRTLCERARSHGRHATPHSVGLPYCQASYTPQARAPRHARPFCGIQPVRSARTHCVHGVQGALAGMRAAPLAPAASASR